jgi:hypothetical protein
MPGEHLDGLLCVGVARRVTHVVTHASGLGKIVKGMMLIDTNSSPSESRATTIVPRRVAKAQRVRDR